MNTAAELQNSSSGTIRYEYITGKVVCRNCFVEIPVTHDIY